jgi:hypothetical protein
MKEKQDNRTVRDDQCHGERRLEGRELVDAMFRAALEREREEQPGNVAPGIHEAMNDQNGWGQRLSADQPKGTPHPDLPQAEQGEPLAEEWNTYRREVCRLLADGHEGRQVLIKGAEIIGIFDSYETAYDIGLQRFLLEPFLVHPVRPEEPYLRIRGINFPWPNSRFR